MKTHSEIESSVSISSAAERNLLLAVTNAAFTQKAIIRGDHNIDVTVSGAGKNKEIFKQDVGAGTWNVQAEYHDGSQWNPSRLRKNPNFFGGQAAEADDAGDAGDGDFNDLIVVVLPYHILEKYTLEDIRAKIVEGQSI